MDGQSRGKMRRNEFQNLAGERAMKRRREELARMATASQKASYYPRNVIEVSDDDDDDDDDDAVRLGWSPDVQNVNDDDIEASDASGLGFGSESGPGSGPGSAHTTTTAGAMVPFQSRGATSAAPRAGVFDRTPTSGSLSSLINLLRNVEPDIAETIYKGTVSPCTDKSCEGSMLPLGALDRTLLRDGSGNQVDDDNYKGEVFKQCTSCDDIKPFHPTENVVGDEDEWSYFGLAGAPVSVDVGNRIIGIDDPSVVYGTVSGSSQECPQCPRGGLCKYNVSEFFKLPWDARLRATARATNSGWNAIPNKDFDHDDNNDEQEHPDSWNGNMTIDQSIAERRRVADINRAAKRIRDFDSKYCSKFESGMGTGRENGNHEVCFDCPEHMGLDIYEESKVTGCDQQENRDDSSCAFWQ
jgi:hypothetical protein